MSCLPKISLLPLLLVVIPIAATVATPTALARPHCPHSCGNLPIPYPFGTREGCYLNSNFHITCNELSKLMFLGNSILGVLDISIQRHELRISSWVAADCYDDLGRSIRRNNPFVWVSTFSISHTKNKFMVIGCDSYAYVRGSLGVKYSTGCMSLCDTIDDVANNSCSGIGCCQTSIPEGVRDFNLSARSFKNHRNIMDFNPCSFAFVVEDGFYNFSTVDLFNLSNVVTMPVVLDWAIANETCAKAETVESYACGNNSICYEPHNNLGYRCNCSQGYQGNPYLPNGCQDIDECSSPELNPCTNGCKNNDGGFTCTCPRGYHGDGRKQGQGCISKKLWLKLAIGFGVTIVVFVVGGSLTFWGIKRRRKFIQHKNELFEQNGGPEIRRLLEPGGSAQKTKIFTIEQLKNATNDFHESSIIGRGGCGTVYKAVLPQNKLAAIKKSSTEVDKTQITKFVNEVVVLSQINHRNVVKLLGCCLETEVPLLVYEFITNKTLYHHLHEEPHGSSISWEIRLKIAKETAGALSYLHSDASTTIIHRDVKSTNILLDDNFNAKVSDFGSSRLVPSDKTQLKTMIQGTLGYLDPEYFHIGHLSKKK